MDSYGHGSHVAGIIAATHNDFGIKGINPNAKIMSLKAFHTKLSDPLYAAKALRYAVDNGADIINCSFVEFKYTQELVDAVHYALDSGVVVVAAAGNNGKKIDGKKYYPVSIPGVISVANHTNNNELYKTSNYGKKSVLIAAPGTAIRSTGLDNKYVYRTGTSMAAPFVAGAISLLFSTQDYVDVAKLEERLSRTGSKGRFFRKKLKSAKRINVYNFIKDIK